MTLVVAQRRDVGAAGRAVAEHHRDLRHAHLRQGALVAEDAPGGVPVGEQLGLQRQEAAGAVAQVDHRQPVLDGDVERTHDLLHRQRIPGAALDARVVGVDHHLAAFDDADAAHLPGAVHLAVIGAVGGQRGDLQERRARVEQQLEPLAHGELVLPVQPLDVALRAFVARVVQALAQLGDPLAHRRLVVLERLAAGVDAADDAAHAAPPSASVRASIAPRWKVWPTANGSSTTVPAAAAPSVICSFMLSMTSSASPWATR